MENILGLLEKLGSQSLLVHANRCVVVRNRNATCRRCAETCPTGALSVKGNDLAIFPERCIGCGSCASVCPAGALEPCKPSDKELVQDLASSLQANGGTAVIACERMLAAAEGKYDSARVTGVKCLGRVDESMLVMLAAGGVAEIVMVRGDCVECELSNTMPATDCVCHTANVLLETWKSPVRVRLSERLPASVRAERKAEFDASRREFFSSMRDEARAAAAITAEHVVREKVGADAPEEPLFAKVSDDGTLPHFLPERRGRLLLALQQLGDPEDIMIDTHLFGHVIVDDEKCSSCQMCATFCPTEAIRKFGDAEGDGNEPFGIDHYTGRCVQCHCCEDICPTNAISLSTDVFAIDVTKRGRSERIPMKPRVRKFHDPHSIVHSMSELIGIKQIYER